MMDLLANKLARLRGGGLALGLVATGTFHGFFFRHLESPFSMIR
jgi:hypothetical protein